METSRWPNGTQLPTTFRINTTTRTNSFQDASMVDWLVMKEKMEWLKPGGLRCIWTCLLHTVLDYHYYIHRNKSLWESAENNHLTWVLCDTCCLTVTVKCFQFWHTSRTSTTCRKQVPCLKMNRKHRKVLYWGRWAICECTRDVDHAWL